MKAMYSTQDRQIFVQMFQGEKKKKKLLRLDVIDKTRVLRGIGQSSFASTCQ